MYGNYPPPQQSVYYNQYGDDGSYDDMQDLDDEEGTIPLDEDIDSNYDPSEEEIIEYAEYLGMDSRGDREFFYIAREGLKAPLPKPWRAMRNSKREIFYVNQLTNEMTFVHPCDEFYKNEFMKAKSKQVHKKQNNQISRNNPNQSGANNNSFNNNAFSGPASKAQKLNPPTQLGALKPKGLISTSNNNSLLLGKNNMQTSQNSMLNSNAFAGGSGSKNNSILFQQNFQSNNKQLGGKNESALKNDSMYQSKFQNNDSLVLNKSIYVQGQQSSQNQPNQQVSNEVFIFDEQNGNGLASNIQNRGNAALKNGDSSSQSFDENQFDQQYAMKSSMNQSKLEFMMGENNNNNNNNTNISYNEKQIRMMYTEQSDAMNDDMIDEELHFFENYLKKQYQNQVEEYDRIISSKEEEYAKKSELDQLRQRNRKDELDEEKGKKMTDNQKKLSQLKDKIKKEKYNELIGEMEKQIKVIKQQHEDNVEATNKKAKDDYEFELSQYQEDKSNQYQYKIEDQKKKRKQREELIQNNKEKIEFAKKRLNQKFQEIEIELQYEEVQKLEQEELQIKKEFTEMEENYINELKEEENRIYKLINRDEKDVQKEIFQKKIQIKDLYQRRYDVKKSEEMNKINDKLRKFYQEEQILLDERIKREEQEFINSLIKQKLKEPQKRFEKEMEELDRINSQKCSDIKHAYFAKMKNDEIQGLKRINDLRSDQEKENQRVLNSSYTSQYNSNSNIDIQQQKVLDELQQSVSLKKQDLKLAKQNLKNSQQSMSKQLMVQDLLESDNRVDYLVQKSGQKQDQIENYVKMLSSTNQKGFINSQNFVNSHSQYKSSSKKYDLPLQINQHIFNNSASQNNHNQQNQNNHNQQNQNNHIQQNQNHSNQQSTTNQHSQKIQFQNQRNFSDDEEDEDQYPPITTFLHQNLQQLAHQRQTGHFQQQQQQQHHSNIDQENDQNNPPQSNRVVFPDDDSDDDFHDSFTQEQQRQKYIEESENIRSQINKLPHDREGDNLDEEEEDNQDEDHEEQYQNNMPLQRQDLSYRRSSNGQSQNKPIFIDNQQPQLDEQPSDQKQRTMDVEDPLIQFLDEEWQQIDNLKEELRFDKLVIKKSYEFLQFEKNKVKSQIQLIESNSFQNQDSQVKVKSMKNKLQQLTDAFNDDVKTTRQNQKFLQTREDALFHIEDLLETGNFTQDTLSQCIDKYQKTVVEYVYPKINQQIKQNQPSHGEQSKGNMSLEELLQKTFDLSQQYGDFTNNFQMSNYQIQYRQQLDKQMHLYDLEKQFIKQDNNNNNIHQQSRRPSKYQNFLYTDAEQLDQIFEEQTTWLKNMKQQLNQDLYTNRYAQTSTRRKVASPSYDNLNQKMQAANLLTKRIGNMTVLNL